MSSTDLKFALIICTYKRTEALKVLLSSVFRQTLPPDEICIIDASEDNETELLVQKFSKYISYVHVSPENKGLTNQRNIGIQSVNNSIDIICFLDDDVILDLNYFKNLIETYIYYPDAIGVGGYISNEVHWSHNDGSEHKNKFYQEEYMRSEPKRFQVRRFFGLQPDRPPCYLPTFGHGRSVSFLPPSGKIYQVEHFMGGVASYRRTVFDQIQFSSYFEGYGLYEDADFCFRLNRLGPLYVNTGAQLEHHHAPSGRPNWYKYGQMVIRNGWYVWRVRFPSPSFISRVKWRACSLLLTLLTLISFRKQSFKEGMGRFLAWLKLFILKPKIN